MVDISFFIDDRLGYLLLYMMRVVWFFLFSRFSIFFFLFELIHDNTDITLKQLWIGYLIVILVIMISGLIFWPTMAYENEAKHQTLDNDTDTKKSFFKIVIIFSSNSNTVR